MENNKVLGFKQIEKIKEDIFGFIINGPTPEIRNKSDIINLYNINYGLYRKIENETLEYIRDKSVNQIDIILPIHLSRYEDIYNWFVENECFDEAATTLKKKEKFMGLHSDFYNVQLDVILNDNENNIVESQYDYNKLTLEEKKRLVILLNKIGANSKHIK